MQAIKVSDIAKMANVSPSTVARVLNGSGYVSDSKRRIIEEVINRLGYVPNKVAQGLKKNSTNIIGHVLPSSYVNPFFGQVADAIDKAAENMGYHVLTMVTQMDDAKEKEHVEDLVSHMVEAVIFTAETGRKTEVIEWLVNLGIPVIMIERPRNVSGIDKVLIDNKEGSYIATSHIIAKGHRHIGYIGRTADMTVEIERYEGYCTALSQAGLQIEEKHVLFVPKYTVEYGFEAARHIMETNNPPTAIFAASDVFACGAIQYLYKKGLRIPDDISLVGYDDTLASFLSPPITSLAFPMEEIGKVTIQMILERKRDNRKSAKTVTLTPMLADKGSVKEII